MSATAALESQVALVIGAGSGLGAAIAHRLAAEGAHVVVNDLRHDAAEIVATEVDGEVATPDYAAAKHAIAGLTKSAAAEVAPLVRCPVCDATYSFGEILPVSGGWLA